MLRTALKFMHYERSKSFGITIGIVISIFLIGQQLSTLNFLESLMSSISSHVNPKLGNIWVITDQTSNINALTSINSRIADQLKSVKGVANTYPVVFSTAVMRFENGSFSNVLLIGSEAPSFIMGPKQTDLIAGGVLDLVRDGAISLDLNDKKGFKHPVRQNMMVEINGKHASVVSLTKGVRGYGTALSYTSLDNARNFLGMSPNLITGVLVKVDNLEDIPLVCQRINKSFPGLKAWSRKAIEHRSIQTILKESNMGISFYSLVVFAVISGFFIIGLTLYTSTFDRVKDYGTLKAIGATNGYISRLVILQAFLYAVIGFTISITLLFLMKISVAKAGLILIITPELLIGLLTLTIFISVGGSFFAVAKLKKLEPASVFK